MAVIRKLQDIWDKPSNIADAWRMLTEQGGLEDLEEINTIGDALEQITVADLLTMYPHGFAVGAKAGLYAVIRISGYNQTTETGTLVVKRLFRHIGEIGN